MKKATTIFGSKSERRAFEAIDKHLPSGWKLYGNTPLSQIVEIRKGELTEKKWNYYLKASVDFVLTNPTHEPALAIEFDGLGEGYSSGKTYILERQSEDDPYRQLKTNFKLDVCYTVGLPLIVISFEEIEHITNDETVSIVNSMVGLHVAMREYRDTIQEWDREGKGIGKTFEELLWDDSVLRTRLRFQHDPVLSRLEASWEDFEALGAKWRMSSVSRPDCMTALRETKPFSSVGCRYEVMGGKLQKPVSVTVWIRNFAGEEMGSSLDSELIPTHGINPLQVAENIAWYLGQQRAIEISRRSSSA